MMEDSISKQDDKDQEIDLMEIFFKLWKKRMFIIKVTAIFFVLGVLVALFSAKVYTAQCVIVPQVGSSKSSMGNLGGLAAIAGINLGGMESGELLSPKIYSKIVSSVPFQKDLMQMRIKFDEYDESVQVLDYYTDKKYQKFSLIGSIKKYTIGLPGLLIKASKGSDKDLVPSDTMLMVLTKKENECVKALKDVYSLSLNEKEGYFTLNANMPEPLAAAQFASGLQRLLQKYVTAFKIEKVKNNLEFVEERYRDAKDEFELKQKELALYRDANRNVSLRIASIDEERLKTQVDLLFSVYSELAKQKEQASIRVKETTPIFTVVDPVTVPMERSKPKRALICVAFTFLGGIVGIGLVLILPFLAEISGNKRLINWLPQKK